MYLVLLLLLKMSDARYCTKHLFLVRHCQSHVLGRDGPLTSLGVAQAKLTGLFLRKALDDTLSTNYISASSYLALMTMKHIRDCIGRQDGLPKVQINEAFNDMSRPDDKLQLSQISDLLTCDTRLEHDDETFLITTYNSTISSLVCSLTESTGSCSGLSTLRAKSLQHGSVTHLYVKIDVATTATVLEEHPTITHFSDNLTKSEIDRYAQTSGPICPLWNLPPIYLHTMKTIEEDNSILHSNLNKLRFTDALALVFKKVLHKNLKCDHSTYSSVIREMTEHLYMPVADFDYSKNTGKNFIETVEMVKDSRHQFWMDRIANRGAQPEVEQYLTTECLKYKMQHDSK